MPRGVTHVWSGSQLRSKRLVQLLLRLPGEMGALPNTIRESRRGCDRHVDKWRHLIESVIVNSENPRNIATRYKKAAHNCTAGWHLAAWSAPTEAGMSATDSGE